jgi:glutamate--cysteine ligase
MSDSPRRRRPPVEDPRPDEKRKLPPRDPDDSPVEDPDPDRPPVKLPPDPDRRRRPPDREEDDSDLAPITRVDPLVAYIESGAKPATDRRIGIEHEKFVYRLDDLGPAGYGEPRGVQHLLAALEGPLEEAGWHPVLLGDERVGIESGDAAISLEPGGQLELAGTPLGSLHAVRRELVEHLRLVSTAARGLGLGLLAMGFHPLWARSLPWVPKDRFLVMRRYMPQAGGHGLDMMQRTCSTQASLDFTSEADMVRKLRVALALQPLAAALFASSPFVAGRPCGHLSHRSFVWTDTDADRCGIPEFVFEEGMGYERYVDWALDVPMYSIERRGRHLDATGHTFREFLCGRAPTLGGEEPILRDFIQHLNALSPEVRLKRVIEMRGADSGPPEQACGVAALWTGLLYDDDALDGAWELVRDWKQADRVRLRRDVPTAGLAARTPGGSLQAVARRAVALARDGLARRARLDPDGNDESIHLEAVHRSAESGRVPAHPMLASFRARRGADAWRAARTFASIDPDRIDGDRPAPHTQEDPWS